MALKKEKEQKVPKVVSSYETEIEYECPVRGKVKQKVLVKRLESVESSAVEEVLPSSSLAEKLDRKFSGLFISDDSVDDESEEQEIYGEDVH